ncbi:STAS-like domain-containing protein [Alcanivoracaceae bacterium MT1]
MSAVDDLVRASRSWDDGDIVSLDINSLGPAWPNITTTLAATLEYLRTARNIKFRVDGYSRQHKDTLTFSPGSIRSLSRDKYPTSRVWKYTNEDEAQIIADRFMGALTELVLCEAGVIDTLNWCVYEVLDNVFQHSLASEGYVMMQVHVRKQRCVIAVADTGRGIHRAMADAAQGSSVDRNRIRTAEDAIEHALEQGVTSKGSLNQGNGLHGLRRAVEINGGQLSVRSGRGNWQYAEEQITCTGDRTRPLLDSEAHHSTTVDWRLECATPVSITEALGSNYDASSLLESTDFEDGYVRIEASEIEQLVGSRLHGNSVRTRILNYLSAGANQVVIDLGGIPLVSSSFADEVLGKLALEMGELEFRRRVFLDGASPTNLSLVERAIQLRLESHS